MDRFSKLNPKVTFLFFLLAIVLSLILFNPVLLLIGFICSFLYNIKLDKITYVKSFFKFILPMVILIALFNSAFSHYGDTVIFVLFGKNFTFESFFYGLCQGMLFAQMMMWISAYSRVVTSDRFLSIFANAAPNSAMIFSMVLSFIPRLRKNAREISDARMLCKEENKLKKSISNFSALITMTLEESIEISDSMKARGYSKDRKSYSRYKFRIKDALIIVLLLLLFFAMLYFKIAGRITFVFEPKLSFYNFSFISIPIYFVFSSIPLIIDLWEDVKWIYLKRKI